MLYWNSEKHYFKLDFSFIFVLQTVLHYSSFVVFALHPIPRAWGAVKVVGKLDLN